ncbi:PfkB-like carbohydrate kinase family protein isoform 1 [Theobroma cacao]|uniref:PfkB-like carbohydrate kinase family protein isoform 1 n=1 Tax=Theobroma cacao TaxID=3641 RepID=A0A061EZI4_THECC|nr:PfkB-like carbohydrate kinase family protein isoform 1 [Theobroma cacao]
MSFSFVNSISSPPQTNSLFCSPFFSLYHLHSYSFSSLYHRKESYANGRIMRASRFLGDGKGNESVNFGSMGKKKSGLFWVSSRCSSRRSSSCSSSKEEEFESEGEEEEEEDEDEENAGSFCVLPDRWDVLGLGQAMVDFSGMVDDEFLERLELEKGTRKVVNHEERGRVLRAMDGCSYKAAAGGSLSNSLVALARLGSKPIGGPMLNVAMAGSIGSDPLGGFYRAKLHRANVNFLSEPIKDGTTGTVIVLTTPDAQRTMLAYQGTSSTINYDSCLAGAVSKTNIFVVEGYLFELPDTIKTILKACEEARQSGALVAVTASDISCIERHYDDFWEIVGNYADIVFANSDEAGALCHFSSKESPISATRYLSHFVPLVSVTDGPRGSYIGVKGEAVYIPPSPCVPVDTCGAGDAYASGILYGILRGVSDLKGMGTLAARIAATVVGQLGTRLRVQDAVDLSESFAFNLASSTVRTDVDSDHISSL